MGNEEKLGFCPERIMLAAGAFRGLADIYSELLDRNAQGMEYKSAIMLQLDEMAHLLDIYSGYEASVEELGVENRKAILKGLKARGIMVVELLLVNRGPNNRELRVSAYATSGSCITVNEMARILGVNMGNKFIPVDNQCVVVNQRVKEYYFRSAPRFESICKVASRCKNNCKVSGDCFTKVGLVNGREIMCIVDGMGSGKLANHDSKVVIELLEQFLEAGFSENAAIRMINTAFSINDYVGNPVTLDMCVIDMYLGVCNFIKLGAVATFIKRKDWVEVIKSTTLPIGVLETVDFDNTVKKLYDGDYIIMVSDGVLDALSGHDKEYELSNLIGEIDVINPQTMADCIIDEVLKNSSGIPGDDMTVVVMLINSMDY